MNKYSTVELMSAFDEAYSQAAKNKSHDDFEHAMVFYIGAR
jgi:hypothetical protein